MLTNFKLHLVFFTVCESVRNQLNAQHTPKRCTYYMSSQVKVFNFCYSGTNISWENYGNEMEFRKYLQICFIYTSTLITYYWAILSSDCI